MRKRRQWRKLHITLNTSTLEVFESSLTDNSIGDATEANNHINSIDENINEILSDGAYDCQTIYNAIGSQGGVVTIPPPTNAVFSKNYPETSTQRDSQVEHINRCGRSAWEIKNRFSKRLESQPGEFHQLLAKLYVTLSRHTAPRDYEYFYHILSIPRAPPIRWLALVPLSLPPLRSIAITASSSLLQEAPPLDAASILSVSPYKGLCLSLSIRNEGSCSSVKSPRHIHATYTPDRAYPGMWSPGKLNKLVANGRAFPHHLNSYDAYTVVQFLSSL